MLALLLVTALSLAPEPADTFPAATPEAIATAYLDADARETVRLVRERRREVDRSIVAYRAVARERISVGLRALRRDRVVFRREIAARVHWRREGLGRVEVLGARQVVPMALPKPTVPDGAGGEAADLAFDPAGNYLLGGFSDRKDGEGGDDFLHPLAPGAEKDYRFQTGDTTQLRLSAGRTLRLVELHVIPRRTDLILLRGSFWVDAETHAPVRAVFELTRPVDLHRDLDDDDEDIPAALKPIRGELRYITIEYGLWDQRWWLPRRVALEAVGQAAHMVNVPVTFERSYTDYQVTSATDDSAAVSPAARDSVAAAKGAPGIVESCDRGTCFRFAVQLPADRPDLLTSDALPPSIFQEGEAMLTEAEIREIGDVLGMQPPLPGGWQRPRVEWGYLQPDLLRYNRVEGLALGGRVDADLGPASVGATVWLETAGPGVSGDLGVTRDGFRAHNRLAVYRRVAAVDPDPRALGIGSSLSALLLGRDDSDYFRTLGVELEGSTRFARPLEYRWRAFLERQSTAEKATDFSLPHLLDGSRQFPVNIRADEAEQVGASVSALWTRGADPLGFRWGGEAALGAEAGTFRFVRPSLAAHAGFPLPMGLVGALEWAGGSAFGDVPLQRQWFLGGPGTVRGFGGGTRIHGDSFWRTRAEVGSAFPGARIVVFSDAGWAGAAREAAVRPERVSAGVGVGLLDGLLRLDLARALRGGSGWRLDLHLDAPL